MASSDYIIQHNDPNNGTFVIKPYTANGPATPSSSTFFSNPTGNYHAISANTSLVLIGKGIVEYGEVIDQNLVYLTEHFSNKTRPMYPMQGQIWYKNANYADATFPSDPQSTGLYVYDGANWDAIAMTGSSSGNLNMSNFQIVNLADPTTSLGAVNVHYANASYVTKTGDSTVTGNLTITGNVAVSGNVTIPNAPTQATQATNKQYVDVAVNTVNDALNAAVTNIQSSFLHDTGGILTGPLELTSSASLTLDPSATATITLGNRRVQQIATPINTTDAANKVYVDSAITQAIASIPPPAGSADGVVNAGALNASTGVLTLNRTQLLPDVIISGSFAPFSHTHLAPDVLIDMSVPYRSSYLYNVLQSSSINFPTVPAPDMFKALDQAAYKASLNVSRTLVVPTTTGVSDITLQDSYVVGSNKLQIFKGGIKQLISEKAAATIEIGTGTPSYGASIFGLSVSTPYTFTLTIDGTAFPISITTPAQQLTFTQLLTLIQNKITAAQIPVNVQVLLLTATIRLSFISRTSGAGSSASISYTTGELFTSIAGSSVPINKTITTSYAYSEIGNPGALSNQIHFTAPLAINDQVEILTFP